MCKAMNRSLANVLFSGFGAAKQATKVEGEVKPINTEDAYLILEAAQSVYICAGLRHGGCPGTARGAGTG